VSSDPASAAGPAPVAWVALAVGAAVAAVAGVSFQRALSAGPLLPAVAVAAVASAAVSGALTGWRRWALPPVLAASAVAWTVTVSVQFFHRPPNGRVLSGIGQALGRGWWQLLTTVPPAPAAPALLTCVSLLVWLGAFAAAETVLRGRSALLPLLGPLAVFVLGLLSGAGGPGSGLPEAAAFTALSALMLLVRSEGTAPRRALRRYATGLPLVAAVAALAVVAGPALPFAHARPPYDPRTLVTPPQRVKSAVNPLDQVTAWLSRPRSPLFTVRTSSPQDLRLAVLDRFDGRDWTSRASYLPTGSRVPPDPAMSGSGTAPLTTAVRQTVRIEGLDTVWLPAAARPATVVAAATVDVDPGDGQLLVPAGTRPGTDYRIVSRVPDYSAAELRAAVPATGDTARTALALPAGAPAVISEQARTATKGAAFPYQQAVRLADYLRTTEKYDPEAAPGHTFGHIAYFLSTSHRGTSEQFATSFALMARTLGLPSRVVVGFRAGTRRTDGSWQITGADALVWPEVDFAGLGWVPFSPTPIQAHDAGARRQQSVAGAGSTRDRIDRKLADEKLPSPAPSASSPSAARPHARGGGSRAGSALWGLGALTAAVVLAAAGYLVAAVLLPRRRLRRLRFAATPAASVTGAWEAAVRRLSVLGLGDVATRTCPEIAAYARDRLAADAAAPLTRLATAADHSGFSGTVPNEYTRRTAWSDYDALSHAVRTAVPWHVRARRALRWRAVWGR
jgi:hypothetical protein